MDTKEEKGQSIIIKNKPLSNGFSCRLSVLVVENNKACLFIIEKMLQSCGHKGTP